MTVSSTYPEYERECLASGTPLGILASFLPQAVGLVPPVITRPRDLSVVVYQSEETYHILTLAKINNYSYILN